MKRRLTIARVADQRARPAAARRADHRPRPAGAPPAVGPALPAQAAGVTLVLTTHYMDEAEQLCDRLVVMDKAKIVAEGSPRELIEQLLDQRGRSSCASRPGIAGDARRPARRPRRPGRDAARPRAALRRRRRGRRGRGPRARAAARERRSSGAATLEDVFLRLTGRTSSSEPRDRPRPRRASADPITPALRVFEHCLRLPTDVARLAVHHLPVAGAVPRGDGRRPRARSSTRARAARSAASPTWPSWRRACWPRQAMQTAGFESTYPDHGRRSSGIGRSTAMLATPIRSPRRSSSGMLWLDRLPAGARGAAFVVVMVAVRRRRHRRSASLAIPVAVLTGLAFATPIAASRPPSGTTTGSPPSSGSSHAAVPVQRIFFPIDAAAGAAAAARGGPDPALARRGPRPPASPSATGPAGCAARPPRRARRATSSSGSRPAS